MKIVAVRGANVPPEHAMTLDTFGEMQILVDTGRAASIVNRGGVWTLLDDADRSAPFVDAGIVTGFDPNTTLRADIRAWLEAVR
jgi:hypothetical protein